MEQYSLDLKIYTKNVHVFPHIDTIIHLHTLEYLYTHNDGGIFIISV